MPEAPEVYIVSRQLRKFIGQSLRKVETESGWTSGAKGEFVKGCSKLPLRLIDVKARGKQLVLCFENEIYLAVHYMLTGQFRVDDQPNNIRATFYFDSILYFCDARNFAHLVWLDKKGLSELLSHIGPSILNVSKENFIAILSGSSQKIAAALHDQSLVSGIGNYLRAESLYKAGIMPDVKTNNLSTEELTNLFTALKNITSEIIESGGTYDYEDLYGNRGGYKYAVYGRKKTDDGTNISKMKIGSQTVYYVPTTQWKMRKMK